MELLNLINVVVGLAFIMLVLSMVVTALTQMFTAVANSKGRNLRNGMMDLLRHIYHEISPAEAKQIAEVMLKHPLIADAGKRMGTVIQREECAELLLELATGKTPSALPEAVKTKLVQALGNNGVSDPEQTLLAVRNAALVLEGQRPELANARRHAMALLAEANSHFLAKLNSGFDRIIERVGERFTFSARVYTVVAAAALTGTLQLDTLVLVERLNSDKEFQTRVVEAALNAQSMPAPDSPAAAGKDQSLDELRASARMHLKQLMDLQVIGGSLFQHDQDASIVGMLLTTILLSFGAPFWYQVLKGAIRLRSSLAERDDKERAERQSNEPPVATPAPTAVQEDSAGAKP